MSASGKYILDAAGKPQLVDDVALWAIWFEVSSNRVVAQTNVGEQQVSTVFLGLDHNFDGDGPPVLWESMIFKALDGDDRQQRYSSRDDAVVGHEELVETAKRLLDDY